MEWNCGIGENWVTSFSARFETEVNFNAPLGLKKVVMKYFCSSVSLFSSGVKTASKVIIFVAKSLILKFSRQKYISKWSYLNLAWRMKLTIFSTFFFQPFCGNERNWIFRNLEFSGKFLEFRQKILEFSRKILKFGGKWLVFILKNCILLTKIVICDDLATFLVLL